MDSFALRKNSSTLVRGYCRPCENARRREVYATDPERHRATARRSQLKKDYGLTVEEYERMLVDQGGGCAVCGSAPEADRALSVDHNHRTGVVRSLLCVRCNSALGMVDDSTETLRRLITYLEVDHQ